MNYDDLKEQLIEKIEEFKDSELWQTTAEKFQGLAPNAQKAIIGAGIFFVTLFFFGCLGPVGYMSESSDAIAVFEEKRDQIRKLLAAKQRENQTSSIPQQMSPEQFRNSVQSVLTSSALLPEQNGGVATHDVSKSSLKPKNSRNIKEEGLKIELKKLNLDQIVDIGFKLENINEAVKMAGMDIVASVDDDHYFDVTYRLIRFSLDTAPKEPEENNKRNRARRKKRNN